MKIIEELSDFDNLTAHYLVRDFLFDYLYYFVDKYQCTDLKKFGAFCLLTSEEDFERYQEIGLSLPFDKAVPEFTELMNFKTNHESVSLVHCWFQRNNETGVSVFFDPELMNEEIHNNLFDDFSITEVTINVSRE